MSIVKPIVLQGAFVLGLACTVHAADASRVLEPQHVGWAVPANDTGVAAAGTSMHLTMLLETPDARKEAFAAFLRQQQDPHSPQFHHWLRAEQIGERFGASPEDIETAKSWLLAQGLRVDGVSNSRMRIAFSGQVQTINRAFATEIHSYVVHGEQRLAPANAPRIPAAVTGIVHSIVGFSTLREHAAHGGGSARGVLRKQDPAAPAGTFCTTSDACTRYLFPADFAKIYDADTVYAQGIDGTGQTIAVIGRARVYLPDIENFQMRSGLAQKDPTIIVPPTGVDPGPALSSGGNPSDDQLEATIDVTRATSVAPGAQIDLVVSADGNGQSGLRTASEYVVDSSPPIAQVMSISFGACEAAGGPTGVAFYDGLFQQAAAEGISVFVISGDSGAAGCDAYNSAPPATQNASSNYICVSSYATCVGGTQFADTTNPTQYWNSSNDGSFSSALGYIPEGAWNEPVAGDNSFQASATGGGISNYVPTPYWQTGPGVPGTQGRYTPDVSFSASAHDGYFACFAAAGNTCVTDSTGNFRFEYIYGTSASTPDMAGVAALLNQKMNGAQGNLNQRLYALAANSSNGVFHDATPESSGVANCDLATPSICNNSTPASASLSGGLQGFALTSGYDLATGLGSINIARLLANWNTAEADVNLDQFGLTGAWYDPQNSGQGVLLQVFPDMYGAGNGLLFGGWFTYAANAPNGQRWYTIQGPVDAVNRSATLPVYATYGGDFNAPPRPSTIPVGEVTLAFSDCTHGRMSYHLTQDDGSVLDGTMPISRLGSNITCGDEGDNGSDPGNAVLSGAWYDPNASGQGFLFTLDPASKNIFAAWYTFIHTDPLVTNGSSQRWYTLQVGGIPSGIKTIQNVPLYAASGGVFDNPAPVQTDQVGTADIAYQDCQTMNLTYRFTAGENQGATGTVALTHVASSQAPCGF